MLTNTSDDRLLRIRGDSIMYDDLGNGYFVYVAQIANTYREFRASGYGFIYLDKPLLSGVPTKTILSFQGLATEATMIKALRILLNTGNKDYYVNFADIPLPR